MAFFVFLILFISSFISSTSLALSLPEAAKISLEKSERLKQQELELKKAEIEVQQNKAAFFPSLDLTASYFYNKEDPNERTHDWDSSSSLSLNQNFYDHGLSLLGYRLSKIRKELISADYRREKSATLYRTVQLYFEILKAQKIEELQVRNTVLVEKVHRLINAQYRQGVRTRQDFLRFQAQFQRAILSQSSARFDSLRSQEDLRVHLSLPRLEGPFLDYSKTFVPSQDQGPLYETEKRELTQQLREAEEQRTRLDLLPKIDLVGRVGIGSDTYFQTNSRWADNDKTFWSVGLTFNWNLWDAGQRRAAQDIARLETLRQDSHTSHEERTATSEIEKLIAQIKLLQEQSDIADKLVSVERENYSVIERGFREGRTSFLDYSSSLSNLISVQIQKIQAEYNLMQAQIELEHRKGYLNEASLQ